jgi:hypothetical protein
VFSRYLGVRMLNGKTRCSWSKQTKFEKCRGTRSYIARMPIVADPCQNGRIPARSSLPAPIRDKPLLRRCRCRCRCLVPGINDKRSHRNNWTSLKQLANQSESLVWIHWKRTKNTSWLLNRARRIPSKLDGVPIRLFHWPFVPV